MNMCALAQRLVSWVFVENVSVCFEMEARWVYMRMALLCRAWLPEFLDAPACSRGFSILGQSNLTSAGQVKTRLTKTN